MDFTRRAVLKAAIASFVTSISGQATARGGQGKKVIVIGAGIAGLAAAHTLRSLGAEVIVFEAESYIGGRIRTDHSMGAPFEYGAGWIHGPSRANPVKKLAMQVDAPTFITDDDSLELQNMQRQPVNEADYQWIDDQYEALLRKLEQQGRRWGDRSIYQVIQDVAPVLLNDPRAQWMLSAFIEFDLGAGIEEISAAHAFADDKYRGEDVILPKGYDGILTPLVEGLDIRLNTPVSRVFYGDEGVLVEGEHADYAVCTASLGVLKAGNILFDPPLPDAMRNAIEGIGFGTVTKIALKFERAFWDVHTQYFGIMTEPKGRWNYWINYRTFSEENILLGLSFGHYAPVADAMSKPAMTADALEVLRSVWGRAVERPSAVLATHWSQEPNFRGAYSYPQAGGTIAQYESFESPVAGRIFMAGEHTIFKYHSTTHGALMSGERAAKKIASL